METVKESGLWSNEGSYGCHVVSLVTSAFILFVKLGTIEFWPFKLNLTLKVNRLQKTRDLNQNILHLWSKFGDSRLNGRWVMVQTNSNVGKLLFYDKVDPEYQGQSLRKTRGILTKLFFSCGSNFVILAWMGHMLSRKQAPVRCTGGRTHTYGQIQIANK